MTDPRPTYWRSLEEYEDPQRPAGQDEFPPGATDAPDQATRRDFLKLLGGTAALASLSGCMPSPPDKVLPYVKTPPEVTPGNPLHYATTLTLDGYGIGVIAESHTGRPTKIEGNPEHPASLGATSVIEQAAVLNLFDPQRARAFRSPQGPIGWRSFIDAMGAKAAELKKDGGAKLRFLVEPTSSPLEAWLRQELKEDFPQAKFYAYSPVQDGSAYEGTRIAFGRPLETTYDFDKARVIFSLDADFLTRGPFHVRYSRFFAKHRVPENGLNRLYVVEQNHTSTGATADHRLPVKASEVQQIALALFASAAPERAGQGAGGRFAGHPFVKAAAADLKRAGAAALVVAGASQPPAVHALAAALNAALGSECVRYTAPVLIDTQSGPAQLAALADEINAGAVDTLIITAYNPVYTAPADLPLADLLKKVPNSVYHGVFLDETARHAGWFVPATHELESWGDARAADGTVSILQPLINPLWAAVTRAELYATLLGTATRGPQRLLRELWATRAPHADFNAWWEAVLQKGVVPETAFPAEQATPVWDQIAKAASAPAAGGDGIELQLTVDNKIYDGRFADNAWLQELADPMTKITWGNALLVSPKTAKKLGLETEDAVEVSLGADKVTVPVFRLPGHADDAATLALGYGRAGAETIARELGANAYKLRTTKAPWIVPGITVGKTAFKLPLSITQEHWSMEDRPIALDVRADELKKHGKHLPILEELRGPQPSLYKEHEYAGYKWGMAIDMSKCSGCNACMMACYSENNILVVGAEQVRRSREMTWLRIDRYFTGDPENPQTVMQPMMCVHCENAPCEYVCPVNATVHSDEGLNEMVYNRCVGTRYCSNNCPWKVRRYNWLNWQKNLPATERLAMNPDVTVRARGVMEKCTYCVQRIERARIVSRVEGREIKDGEFTTACAQACPSQAIVFGSLHDANNEVSKWHRDERAYKVLHSLNTRPRTAHLAKVRNPNPELV